MPRYVDWWIYMDQRIPAILHKQGLASPRDRSKRGDLSNHTKARARELCARAAKAPYVPFSRPKRAQHAQYTLRNTNYGLKVTWGGQKNASAFYPEGKGPTAVAALAPVLPVFLQSCHFLAKAWLDCSATRGFFTPALRLEEAEAVLSWVEHKSSLDLTILLPSSPVWAHFCPPSLIV